MLGSSFLFQSVPKESVDSKMQKDMANKDSIVKVYDFAKFQSQESMSRDFPGNCINVRHKV